MSFSLFAENRVFQPAACCLLTINQSNQIASRALLAAMCRWSRRGRTRTSGNSCKFRTRSSGSTFKQKTKKKTLGVTATNSVIGLVPKAAPARTHGRATRRPPSDRRLHACRCRRTSSGRPGGRRSTQACPRQRRSAARVRPASGRHRRWLASTYSTAEHSGLLSHRFSSQEMCRQLEKTDKTLPALLEYVIAHARLDPMCVTAPPPLASGTPSASSPYLLRAQVDRHVTVGQAEEGERERRLRHHIGQKARAAPFSRPILHRITPFSCPPHRRGRLAQGEERLLHGRIYAWERDGLCQQPLLSAPHVIMWLVCPARARHTSHTSGAYAHTNAY